MIITSPEKSDIWKLSAERIVTYCACANDLKFQHGDKKEEMRAFKRVLSGLKRIDVWRA